MKYLCTFLAVAAFFGVVAANGQSKDYDLEFRVSLGGAPFELNRVTQSVDGGYYFKVTRLQFYVSNISLIHSGGLETELQNVYLLVEPSKQLTYSLGEALIGPVDSVRFSIGVDAFTNHLDPAQYPPGHPLAFQNPTTHWGWATGYRFVIIEGEAGTTAESATNLFQIHTAGDLLYRTLTVATTPNPVGTHVFLPIEMTVEEMLRNVNVSAGLINHGSEGEAITVTNNMQSVVFGNALTSDIAEETPSESGEGRRESGEGRNESGEGRRERGEHRCGQSKKMPVMSLAPNPTSEFIAIDEPSEFLKDTERNSSEIVNREVVISNAMGNVVFKTDEVHFPLRVNVCDFVPGVYALALIENGKVVARGNGFVFR